jgi:hypothetical protein
MHKLIKTIVGLFLLVFLLAFKTEKKNVTISFNHFVGNEFIVLDSGLYKNEIEEFYSITKLKYYVSDIELTTIDGKIVKVNSSFLVDENKKDSKNIVLKNCAEGNYLSLSFIVGVDSLHNCSGVQSGSLDPVNGMFWEWNTGYIFFKLEGISGSSTMPGSIFEYHIGGFKAPTNCIRKITIPLNQNSITSTINLKVDINKIFSFKKNVSIAQLPIVADQANSVLIADQYAQLFSLLDK